MICKKCKTAYNQKTNNCPYCGNYFNRNIKLKVIFGSFMFASILFLCAFYLIEKPVLFNKSQYTPAATDVPGSSQSASNDNPVVTETPDNVLIGEDKEIADLKEQLKTASEALDLYFEKFSDFSVYISNNGFLYENLSEKFITIDDLIDTGVLDENFRSTDYFLMYLMPSDFLQFGEVRFHQSTSLEMFAGIETKDGIYLRSKYNSGMIYREHFNVLIEKYGTEHGKIIHPDSKNEDYYDIKKLLDAELCSSPGEVLFVRSMMVDDKYAVAATSISTSNSVVKLSLLKKEENGGFLILLKNVEVSNFAVCELNEKAPDLNLKMVPVLNYEKLSLNQLADVSGFDDNLLERELITDSELPFKYICGIKDYVYAITSSGRRFLFVEDAEEFGGYVPVECDNYSVAVQIMEMTQKTEILPYFILVQD